LSTESEVSPVVKTDEWKTYNADSEEGAEIHPLQVVLLDKYYDHEEASICAVRCGL
jgi:hypothetical protein